MFYSCGPDRDLGGSGGGDLIDCLELVMLIGVVGVETMVGEYRGGGRDDGGGGGGRDDVK